MTSLTRTIRTFETIRLVFSAGVSALVFALPLNLHAQAPATPADQNQQQAVPATPAPDQSAQPAPAPATDSSAQQAQPADAAHAPAQTATPATTPATDASAQAPAPAPAPSQPAANSGSDNSQAGAITEDELRRMLVGKSLYLRGGYLDNNLNFDEKGRLASHSAAGSYTLSGIEIDKVRLSKHKVELDGARYGLHFLGALPYEDPTKAVDRVRITPKKKFVRITIDRELVVTPKKKKEKGEGKDKSKTGPGGLVMPAEPAAAQPQAEAVAQPPNQPSGQPAAPQPADQASAQPAAPAQPADQKPEQSDADQARAEMAAAPAEEQPAAPGSVTTTTSPAHAAKVLKEALDKIFASGLDDRMMTAMPDFWKLYYQAVSAKTDYRPKDPTVLRQGQVDQKAKLLSNFEPASNDFAQDAGVAGMCLYHTVIGTDGKPGEISVARPIGFGLDESAVEAIRKASFQPAIKDGKPVPVVLDLVVQFRIYSKRTNVASRPDDKKPGGPQLPGPYTLADQHPAGSANNQ